MALSCTEGHRDLLKGSYDYWQVVALRCQLALISVVALPISAAVLFITLTKTPKRKPVALEGLGGGSCFLLEQIGKGIAPHLCGLIAKLFAECRQRFKCRITEASG